MKISRLVVPLGLLLSACSMTPMRDGASLPPSPKKVHFVATQSRYGQLEPCGCSITPLGGLAREWNAMDALRTRNPGDAIVAFTQGTTFIPMASDFNAKKTDVYAKKAGYLVEGLNGMGLMALSPTAEDYLIGKDKIQALEKKANFPFVSTNLYDKATGKPLHRQYLELKVGEMNVLVLGFAGLSAEPYPTMPSGVERRDPAASAKEVLATLPKKDRFIVVLSTLSMDELDGLRREVPEIRLALGVRHPEDTSTPIQDDAGFVSFAPINEGRNIAEIVLEPKTGIKALANASAQSFAESRMYKLKSKMDNMKFAAKSKTFKADEKKQYAALASYYQRLLENKAAIPVKAPEGATPYEFAEYTLTTEYENWGNQNQMVDLVKRYKATVRDTAAEESEAAEHTAPASIVEPVQPTPAQVEEPPFLDD